MTSRFAGRIAVITGASRGIGLAIAQRLVEEGARVCITARKPEPLEEAVKALGGPEHAIAVPGKADDPEHQDEAIAATLKAFGSLDMFVNNTGINPVFGRMVDLDLDAARKMVDVNALSAISWVQKSYKAWMGEHGGSVVNVSSIAGIKPAPGIGFYGATKAMVKHITEELAVELAPGIRVNGVAPAVVKTRFAEALYEGREDEVSAQYPMGRLGVPEDVSGAVAHLLSEDSAWVTGQTLVVDGGVTLTGGL
ncbi:3-oxoacyl-ACP reductase [Nocardiopsis kunsanensis]|uniref:3-oxoacyl-ACP reductase n=1 Tax=Nocardiopsis kunsanensis TaxID=141693 RepID=A0A918XEF7_9ACTN|nr:SDR family oxidoreductase [Nocardiopsis kunsanensis]GHD28444.1 3-oxoacyl-ACP reductase [Nocardiopsis kunsanensis]